MIRMRYVSRVTGLIALAAAAASCGDVARQSRAPVYLIVDTFEIANGNKTSPTFTAGPLMSDVLTKGSIFNDLGQIALRIALKDIGSPTSTLTPTSNNEVTITRYHIQYVRADGRNTPGVDVPWPFDGASTGTVPAGATLTLGFEMVRHAAKEESPLVQLRGLTTPTVINTIAYVTFYGHDQVGNVLSVTATIAVEFGDFADPT